MVERKSLPWPYFTVADRSPEFRHAHGRNADSAVLFGHRRRVLCLARDPNLAKGAALCFNREPNPSVVSHRRRHVADAMASLVQASRAVPCDLATLAGAQGSRRSPADAKLARAAHCHRCPDATPAVSPWPATPSRSRRVARMLAHTGPIRPAC